MKCGCDTFLSCHSVHQVDLCTKNSLKDGDYGEVVAEEMD